MNWASLIAHLVKNLPAMQETRVQLLGRENPWRRKWQPPSVFLPGESHGQRNMVDYIVHGIARVRHDLALSLSNPQNQLSTKVDSNIENERQKNCKTYRKQIARWKNSLPVISLNINNGEMVETVESFILLRSKITVDSDCSHEIKRFLLFERKALTNLDKDPYSQSYGFSSSHVHMWYLDLKKGWVLKNWCFQIVKTLESPLDCQRSNQSILKKIKPEDSVEGLMLKLQYFGHACIELTDWKRPWFWERLRAGGEEGNRGWDSWIASPTQLTCVWASSKK